MRAEASAPSNLALIKYMGKDGATGNRPANASLSYTLENLRSFVVIERGGDADEWQPLAGFQALNLSDHGRKKFLAHFARLKARWNVSGYYRVLSANNFPSDCGLASSASSFAALTLATYQLAQSLNSRLQCSRNELSCLSREGSGSSCRSMFSPWAQWQGEGAEAVDVKLELEHAVIVVDDGKKPVTTSEAHGRVNTSLLWPGRPARAEARLTAFKGAVAAADWNALFEICWNEFWDMHALFETSQPSFGYMTQGTLKVLDQMRQLWRREKDGPLVTMDAGANVHLLLRKDQIARADQWLEGHQALRSWRE